MPAAQDAFDHCRAGWLELIAFAAALAGALALRPWRLLTPGARGRLVPTLLVLAAALPLSWWAIAVERGPILKLPGAAGARVELTYCTNPVNLSCSAQGLPPSA